MNKLTTAQLLADKDQLWLVKREAYGRKAQYCRITKSFPTMVVVKSFSENKEVKVWREDLVEQVKPGMGCSGGWGNDSYPYTIVSVSKSGKRVNVQADDYDRATNKYTPNLKAPIFTVLLRADGSWWNKDKGLFGIGKREYYIDPSF